MIKVLRDWYQKYFSDPQAVLLVLILVIGFTIILTLGKMLVPVLAALVIAFLLESIVNQFEKRRLPRLAGVVVVNIVFMLFLLLVLFGMAPLLSSQLTEFVRELPVYINKGQQALMQLPQHYPFISESQLKELTDLLNKEIASMGQHILSLSLSSIPGVLTLAVYLVLLPMLVFFFMKDKRMILNWFTSFLPRERGMASQVWDEMDQQLGNYVRGKFWEIVIVGVVCFIAFSLMGLKYAFLLSVLVGLSVLVPYIGATVVTLPVAFVAYVQWGWGSDFAYLMLVYGIIQALDANVLVPLLFSGVVNLHPVAIIVSILVFGGLWGFWGVFFAIPLATLVNATVRALKISLPDAAAVDTSAHPEHTPSAP
ncbi:MAG: AI-2E family transporter [Gammaproteobacteria bacterium]